MNQDKHGLCFIWTIGLPLTKFDEQPCLKTEGQDKGDIQHEHVDISFCQAAKAKNKIPTYYVTASDRDDIWHLSSMTFDIWVQCHCIWMIPTLFVPFDIPLHNTYTYIYIHGALSYLLLIDLTGVSAYDPMMWVLSWRLRSQRIKGAGGDVVLDYSCHLTVERWSRS